MASPLGKDIYYFIGSFAEHAWHAIPLHKEVGGTFVVTSQQAKEKLDKLSLPTRLINNTDGAWQTAYNKAFYKITKKARYLILGRELKQTFDFLEKQAKVVVFYELFEFTRFTKLNMPKTIFLTHGNFLKDYFGSYPRRIEMMEEFDYMAGIGPATKRRLIQKKYVKPEKLVNIGIARTDEFAKARGLSLTTQQSIKKVLGLDNGKKIVSYIPTYWGESSIDGIGIDVLRNFPNEYELVFRPHPQTPKDILDKYLKLINNNKNIHYISGVSHKKISISEMLGVSDAIIGDYSSVVLESILLDKPLLFAQNDTSRQASKYSLINEVYTYSEKITPKNVGDLPNILASSIKTGINKKVWDKSKTNLFFNYSGDSAKTIASFIRNLY